MNDLLHLEGLRRSFGDFLAIDDLNLVLPAGRLTSIIGPNGAGKTTLINLVTGLLSPDRGRVLLEGCDITRLSADQRVRRGLGRSFQVSTVFSQMTVADNLRLPVLARRNPAAVPLRRLEGDAAVEAEVDGLLDAFDIQELREQQAGSLAHGNQRFVELAMAVASRPRLCFLDEPCAGLNPSERERLLQLISRLKADTTFIVVEHDMDVVFAISEWIIVLNRGAVLAEGPPDRIRADAAVRETYLGGLAS